jgi:hypothetical protein
MFFFLIFQSSFSANIGLVNKAPISYCSTKNSSGFVPELIGMLIEDSGVKLEEINYICYENYDTAYEALKKKEVDATFLPMIPKYYESGSFSVPFLNNGLVLLVKNHQKSLFFLIYEPIEWKLWIALLILPLIISHIFWFFERSREGEIEMSYKKGILSSFWQVFLGFFSLRREPTRKISTRLIILSYWFLIFMTSASYISTLASRIGKFSRYVEVDHFQSLEDRLVGTYSEFSSSLETLGINSRIYSPSTNKPYKEIVADILDERLSAGAFPYSEALLLNSEYCELTLIGSIFVDSYLAFAHLGPTSNQTLMNTFQASLHDLLDQQLVKKVLYKHLLLTSSKKCNDGLDFPLPVELVASCFAYTATVLIFTVPFFILFRKKLFKGKMVVKDNSKIGAEAEKEILEFMNMMIKFECLLGSSKNNFNLKFKELKENLDDSKIISQKFVELLKELEFRIENI